MRPESKVYTSFAAALQEQLHALEQENGYLRDKVRGLVTGGGSICALPECHQFIGERLYEGFCTCSEHCTARLRTRHRRMLAARERKQLATVEPAGSYVPLRREVS